MSALPSRDPSRPQFNDSSRASSRLGANAGGSSIRLVSSPGLSTHDPRSTRILELRLQEPGSPTVHGELTHRDLAILQELDSHRYMDRGQLQALFFPGPRSCQYRLRRLVDLGLVHSWQVIVRPGRLCRASVYLLSRRGAAELAEWRDQDLRAYYKRAEHALGRRSHLVHQLEANQFFVELASASRDEPEIGLYHWVGEHEITDAYAEDDEHGPIPDGWGRLLLPDRELLLHLEWDRGTEQLRRLRAKLLAYQRYFADRPHASANQVLLIAPTSPREHQLQHLIEGIAEPEREGCRFRTTTAALLRTSGPLEAIWSGVESTSRISLTQLAGLPRSERAVRDSIGKPGWWLRRPSGGSGA